MTPDLITIENDGQRLVSTNYWSTPNAAAGYVYMSINAGAYRLLVPRGRSAWLRDMSTAREVVITRGQWRVEQRADALEVLFDDWTDTPFAIHMLPEQWDRLPSSQTDLGWHGVFRVYAEGQPAPALICDRVYYRLGELPCLKPAPTIEGR